MRDDGDGLKCGKERIQWMDDGERKQGKIGGRVASG